MSEQTLMPLSHNLCVGGCVGGWVFVCGCVFVCVCVCVVVRVGIHADLCVHSSCDLIN